MSIILNEYEWAEKAIRDHDLGSKPLETLSRVARYYHENQCSKKEIRDKLEAFLLQCDPRASTVKWSGSLDWAMRRVGKYPLIQMDSVDITTPELERIEKLGGKQIRRLAFTLLCVGKYWDNVSEKNNHWVNSEDREIIRMANISTSIRRQCAMYKDLLDFGLIRFSKKVDNLNVQLLFITPGEVAMRIRDFRNLGYQYMRQYESGYYECESCGITAKVPEKSGKSVVTQRTPQRGGQWKYCPDCAAKIRALQNVEAMRRRRAKANV